MGDERRIFHELEGDLASLTTWQLQEALQEIASGTSSFGPHPEWHVWYHYLLWNILPRSHEFFVNSLLESLVTGFIALYPNGVRNAPYPGFQQDALLTLGRCIMQPACWNDGEIVVGSMLHRSNNNPNRVWCWWDASGDFSASMFFCLKYLPTPLVQKWFQSVLDIGSPHWRAQVIVWLVGSYRILGGQIEWPSEFRIEDHPSVSWEWSHCLKPELVIAAEAGGPTASTFVPTPSRTLVLETAYSHFSVEVFSEWLTSIKRVSYLEAELAELHTTFQHMYVFRQ